MGSTYKKNLPYEKKKFEEKKRNTEAWEEEVEDTSGALMWHGTLTSLTTRNTLHTWAKHISSYSYMIVGYLNLNHESVHELFDCKSLLLLLM